MTGFERWLRRRMHRLEGVPRLEASLLGGRLGRYFTLRLAPVLINRSFAYGLHVVEAFLVARYVGRHHLVRSFVISAVCQLVMAMHWSVTELLRQDLHAAASKTVAQRIGSGWLAAALLFAIAFFIGGGVAVHWIFEGGHGEWTAELYGLACVLRTAIDLVARTYYSTAFAYGRIYRPFFTLWGPQWISFGCLILGARYFGAAGLALGVIAALPWSRLPLVHYVTRAHRASRRPLPTIRIGAMRGLSWRPRALLVALLAGATTKLGVFAVFGAAFSWDDSMRVAIIYFLGPTITSAAGFAQAFYPDLKRLARREALRLYRRLLVALFFVALFVAAWWWGAAEFVQHLVLQPLTVLKVMAPPYLPWFILTSALVAIVQVALLASGQLGALALHGGLLIGALVWPLSPAIGMGSVALALVWGLYRLGRSVLPAPPPSAAQAFSFDASRLGAAQRRALLERLGGDFFVSRTSAQRIYGTSDLARAALRQRLVVASAGLAGALVDEKPGAPIVEPQPDVALRALREQLPEALVLSLRRPRAVPLRPALLQAIWREALRGGRRRRVEQREYEVAALSQDGILEAIVLVPRTVDRARRAGWRARLRA